MTTQKGDVGEVGETVPKDSVKSLGPVSNEIQAAVEEVRRKVAFENNPYFIALAQGTLGLDDFVETQKQFLFAVSSFGRPMAVLSSRMEDLELRTALMRNVWEEHGEGNLSLSHTRTFKMFLHRLSGHPLEFDAGLDARLEEALHAGPEVRVFNLAIAGACSAERVELGLSVMGIIEHIFAEVSSWIGRAIVKNGWLKAEDIVHYGLHETLDVRHAQDFFRAIEPSITTFDDVRVLKQDLYVGAHLFDEFFRRLFSERKRRKTWTGKAT